LHGSQSLAGALRTEPLTYYSRRGPAGDVFRAYAALPILARRIGVIGLGAGTLAAYAKPDEQWTFFEINPAVVRIASDPAFFTFLSDAFPGGKNVRVVEGDARLQIAREPGNYGVLVIDAFSSDAIPVHLVTEEALASYSTKLTPSGFIAWHVSNRHVNLGPVLAALAAAQGYTVLGRRDFLPREESRKHEFNASCWIVMSKDRASLAVFPNSWQPVKLRPGFRSWTDDRSSVVPVLSL
jgi:spermidine synthase